MAEQKMLKVTLVKSPIGAVPKHKATVQSMGLRKLNKSILLPDNAATRGQIQQIRHLGCSLQYHDYYLWSFVWGRQF